METLTAEQLLLLVVLLLVVLIPFLLGPWLRRQMETARTRAAEPAAGDAPRRATMPSPVRAAQTRREAQQTHLPPARADLARSRRSYPFRLGSRRDLRRAILLMAILGPCRGLERLQRPDHPSDRGTAEPRVGASGGRLPAGAAALLLAALLALAAGVTSAAQAAQPNAALAQEGARIYQQEGCPICHQINGNGGTIGPDLTQVGARRSDPAWLLRLLRDPNSVVPGGSAMPPFKHLPEPTLRALVAYMLSLK